MLLGCKEDFHKWAVCLKRQSWLDPTLEMEATHAKIIAPSWAQWTVQCYLL